MKHYKITDAQGQTKNQTQWGENITHEITKPGNTLCSHEVFHGYRTPGMAVFMNPVGGNYDEKTMLLWEAEGVKVADDGTKLGFKKQTTIRQIEKPSIATEQRVEIAIRCVLKVYKDRTWRKWARSWLNGTDRTAAAAYAADATAYATAYAADATAYATAYATANATANATKAAAYAAYATANATEAATNAAEAAAYVVAYEGKKINISLIIRRVLNKGG